MRRAIILLAAVVGLFLTSAVHAAAPLADEFPNNTLFYIGWNGGDDLQKQYDQSNMKQIHDAIGLPGLINMAYANLMDQADSSSDKQTLQQTWQLAQLIGKHRAGLSLGMLPADHSNQFNVLVLLAVQGGDDSATIALDMQALADQANAQPEDSDSDGKILVYQHGDSTVMQMFVQADPKLNKDTFEEMANKKYFASDDSQTLANNANFTAAMQPLQPNPTIAVYCDVRGAMALLDQIMASQDPSDIAQFDQLEKIYGVDSFKWLAATGGFNGADWQSDVFIGVDNATESLADSLYFSSHTLTDQDYQLAPASAAQAYIGYDNFNHYLDRIAQMAGADNPHGMSAQQFQAQIAQLNQAWGLDLQKDLLSPLTGTWALYQPVDSRGALSDPVVAHPLADGAAFGATLAKVYAQINTMLQAEGAPVAITHLTSGDVPYDTLALPLPGIAPTVSVYKNKLILGFSTQAVLDAAAQDNTNTPLNSNPDLLAIEQKLGLSNSLNSVNYIQTKEVVSELLSYTKQVVLPILVQQKLIPADYQLPPIEKAFPYLTPSADFMWIDSGGIHMAALSPTPGIAEAAGEAEMLTKVVGPAIPAMLAPAIMGARDRTAQVTAMSNERRISMACMEYADDHNGRYPPSLVQALPYIGDPDNPQTMKALIDPASDSTPLVVLPQNAGNIAWINANLPGHCDFVYTGAGMSTANISNGATTVIIYEPLSIHGNGAAVGFADGHVEWVNADRFAQLFTQATAWPAAKQ